MYTLEWQQRFSSKKVRSYFTVWKMRSQSAAASLNSSAVVSCDLGKY
jgi:hypothetical protein